ncbi:phosphomannose isomerase, partial [Trifolium pratense]
DALNVHVKPLKKRVRKSVTKTNLSPICEMNHMPNFMHPYIDHIIDVKRDGNCGYRVIALADKNNEDDYELIKEMMINELDLHRSNYLELYGGEDRLAYIRNALLPSKRRTRRHGVALIEKWLTFPDMGHIVATVLGKVVVKLTKQGASETFFPLRGTPSSNPSSLIVCLGAIPGHYIYVKLSDDCPMPPTCIQWKSYHSPEATIWESFFVDRQTKYDKLIKGMIVDNNKKKFRVGSNSNDPIEL